MKKLKTILENPKYVIGSSVAISIIILLVGFYFLSGKSDRFETIAVQKKNISEKIVATGNVSAQQNVLLAFSTTGTVTSVPTKVGDHINSGEILGSLDSSALNAELEGARADVVAEQANLATMMKGSRPEEVVIYQQQADSANSAYQTALKNAFLQSQDAVRNKSDNIFRDPQGSNPEIAVNVKTPSVEKDINFKRLQLTTKFLTWSDLINSQANTPTSTVQDIYGTTKQNLNFVKNFLDEIGGVVTDLATNNSGLSSAQINSDLITINSAQTEINNAIASLDGTQSAYLTAEDQLILKQSSATPEAITAEQAKISKMQSIVDNYQSQINHTVVIAPFSGTVTKVDPKVGEVFSAGVPAFGLIGDGGYKVEVQVTENDLAKISLENKATITLDAYGTDTLFPATVVNIDPAETTTNGINSYKVTLYFDNNDKDGRIHSGMTANVLIVAKQSSGVLVVPTSAVITRGTNKIVLTLTSGSKNFTEKIITTGITGAIEGDNSGVSYTEITSGLSDGDLVAKFGNQ